MSQASAPSGFWDSLRKHLPEEEVAPLRASVEEGERTYALILNTKKMSDGDFLARFPKVVPHPDVPHAFLYRKSDYEFGKSILYDAGVYSIEDAAAMMPAYFLAPRAEEVVYDMCAAPGGKALASSLLMEDKGVLVANDVSFPRAHSLSQNVERMGRGNMVVTSNDVSFNHESYPECFDKILVDAPCSGSAMFRKAPEVLADWSERKVMVNHARQVELLSYAYEMLKPGGRIAYSTCSFSYEENEGTILEFLRTRREARLVPLPEGERFFHPADVPEAVYLFPHRYPGEGQFVCLIEKPGELVPTPRSVIELAPYSKYRDFVRHYGLEGRSNEFHREKFYSLERSFDVSHMNLLRYGVKLLEMRSSQIYIPDHHLAAYLGPEHSIPVGKEEAKAYIQGLTFPLHRMDGFAIISYMGLNLGFVKVVKGVAKNHYPKGLRRPEWDPDLDIAK